MANNELMDDFTIPVNADEVESWLPGERGKYETGEHTFRVEGGKWGTGPKRRLDVQLHIEAGPAADVGRKFMVFFHLDGKNPKSLGPLKGFFELLAGAKLHGPLAFKPEYKGRRFTANVFAESFVNQKTGIAQVGYKIAFDTAKMLGSAKAPPQLVPPEPTPAPPAEPKPPAVVG